MRSWILYPLKNKIDLEKRQKNIELFLSNQLTFSEIRNFLRSFGDIERLFQRTRLKKINDKATNQVNHIRQKSDEQMLYLSKNLKNSMNNYLESTKDNLFNFNTRLQADSNDLIMHQTPIKSKINLFQSCLFKV